MKTTYVYKNSKPNIPTTVGNDAGNKPMVDLYLHLREESEKIKSEDLLLQPAKNTSTSIDDLAKQSADENQKKKKKPVALFIIIPVVLIAGGVGGIFAYKNHVNKVNLEGIESLKTVVYSMYTDETHSDVIAINDSDLTTVYDEILAYMDKGYDLDALNNEVTAMSAASKIKASIAELNDANINILSEDYKAKVDEIKTNIGISLNGYTLLAENLQKQLDELDVEYQVYSELKDKINAVEDVSTFTRESFDISKVNNNLCRKDLEASLKVLESEKAVLEANAEFEALYEHDEEGNRKTNKKGVVIEPADEVKAPVLEKIAAAEQANMKAVINKALVQDEIYGTNTAEDVKASFEEPVEEEESESIEDM